MTSKKEGFKTCPSSRSITLHMGNNPHSGLESKNPARVAAFIHLFISSGCSPHGHRKYWCQKTIKQETCTSCTLNACSKANSQHSEILLKVVPQIKVVDISMNSKSE